MQVLNATEISGISPHHLVLKVDMPIMLLGNMNKLTGCANWTVSTVLRFCPT
jgi:hypothetical protein